MKWSAVDAEHAMPAESVYCRPVAAAASDGNAQGKSLRRLVRAVLN
jgi:hypothetical protein